MIRDRRHVSDLEVGLFLSGALFLLVAMISTTSCASTPARSPLETAKLAYVDTSIAYETAMLVAQDYRRAGGINTAQWTRIAQAEQITQVCSPIVRAMLVAWEHGGSKPKDYDVVVARLLAAISEISKVTSEAKK